MKQPELAKNGLSNDKEIILAIHDQKQLNWLKLPNPGNPQPGYVVCIVTE